MRPPSPYLAPGFYDLALAQGRHRAIVGGRWDETGRLQLDLLRAEGMGPGHRLLDIGAGSLRLGCKAVPFLDPGQYWATDASHALMLRGRAAELPDPARLPADHLLEDADFAFPGIPETIDYAIAFAVFTHLPADRLRPALARLRARCPGLVALLLTAFHAPVGHCGPLRQPDGVVTHPDRPPWHRAPDTIAADFASAGWQAAQRPDRLPRGQRLWVARPV
ncbi:MAG TPA: class I SAM-dependent methyltransferase [Paracoccaceae bacterium]|nr:class I SAM-dependent methyltransferase [Paracoccaceae bacterium]HMO71856.1 class I SAM-dependent methyltransferase [Paracoccaceae bacterium]